MIAIFKRELRAYFVSPIGYAFMGFFLLVAGLYFNVYNLQQGNGSFVSTLGQLTFVFMLLVPILTMRLLAEERKTKTDQMLLTAPTTVSSIVLGKYFAAVAVFLATLVLTLLYPAILSTMGASVREDVWGAYLGFFLLGCAFIAIGIFMSSLTENQVTAAASTFAVLLAIFVLDKLIPTLTAAWLIKLLQWFSLYNRYSGFVSGMLGMSEIVYYLSFSVVFVFLAIRSVEKRRWSGG